jgi:hypothetical protein
LEWGLLLLKLLVLPGREFSEITAYEKSFHETISRTVGEMIVVVNPQGRVPPRRLFTRVFRPGSGHGRGDEAGRADDDT